MAAVAAAAAAAAADSDGCYEKMKPLVLRSSDGQDIVVDEAVIKLSASLKRMTTIARRDADAPIAFCNIDAKTMSKVFKYCRKHAGSGSQEQLMLWDEEFIKDLDTPGLFDMILATYDLRIRELMMLSCRRLGDLTEGMTREEVCTFLSSVKKVDPAAPTKDQDDDQTASPLDL